MTNEAPRAVTLEIETIHPEPIHWVGIATFSGDRAVNDSVLFGEKLIAGFRGKGNPAVRIIDTHTREDLGAWLARSADEVTV